MHAKLGSYFISPPKSKTVVFITGAFVSHSCWDEWRAYFQILSCNWQIAFIYLANPLSGVGSPAGASVRASFTRRPYFLGYSTQP
jgi:hypothetical protein